MLDFVIKGHIADSSGRPITNLNVQAMDADQQWFEDRNDDILGNVWVRSDGTFEIPFDKEQFQEGWLEGSPDIYLIVRNSAGEVIHITEVRQGVDASDTTNLTFNIVLDSTEKQVPAPSAPYSHNNERLLVAFASLGDTIDVRTEDYARTLKLLTAAVSAWMEYTREDMWKTVGYDGPQVPRYPWKEPHIHKLGWEGKK